MATPITNSHDPITDLSTAVGLTVPAGTAYALIAVEGKDVRYRDDGTDPTASVGFPLEAGTLFTHEKPGLLKFIEQVPGAALSVNYYSSPY